mgnify:CR=1 FL=1
MTLFASTSQAAIFADDDARRFILEHKKQTETNFSKIESSIEEQKKELDRIVRNQLEFQSENQNLNQKINKIHGDIEQQTFQLEQLKKRQTELYQDLDSRLSKIEKSIKEEQQIAADKEEKENEAYQDGLNKFKESKIKEASWAFSSFIQKYPNSPKTPNALFWLGNSFYALGNCEKAISPHEKLTKQYPDFEKTSEALLVMASCYQEINKSKQSKDTLELIVRDYPNTEAAKEAKSRLSKQAPKGKSTDNKKK